MRLKPIERGKFLLIPLLFALLATAAFAGTNEGFTASLTGATKVKDPEIGQTIQIGVEIQNATQAKGGLVTAKYDAAVFEFASFAPGSLISGLLSLPGTPVLEEDGLTLIQGGGTQLTGSPAAGDGLLGAMTFKVIGEIPAKGAFLSIITVQIQASASDKDSLKYDVGAFGVAVTRTILYTLSGVVTAADASAPAAGGPVAGVPVAGVTVMTTVNKQVFTAQTDAAGQYSLQAPAGELRLTLLPPENSTTLKVTRIPVELTEDTILDLVIQALLPNKIFDLDVVRRHDSASITWFSHLAGIDDVVHYREAGSDTWSEATNPLNNRATTLLLDALQTLNKAGVDLSKATAASIQQTLGRDLTPAQLETLRQLHAALITRKHTILLDDLKPAIRYEYAIRSTSLDGKLSPWLYSTFSTRQEPDIRPLQALRFDVQTTPATALLLWQTNRLADTRYRIEALDAAGAVTSTLIDTLVDKTGTLAHIARIDDLKSATAYRFTASSRLIDADALIDAFLMTEEKATFTRTGIARTRTQRPLRPEGPPFKTIGSESVTIRARFNQPVDMWCDYGERANLSAKVTQETDVGDALLYTWRIESTQTLDEQIITVAGLEPSTAYRFRLIGFTPAGDTLNTDPRGNEQWSRDLVFTTSAKGDTLPPVIIENPQVNARGTFAVFKWKTDIDTDGRIYYGTLGDGGTLGTPDEIEVVDKTPTGKIAFRQEHIVVTAGLQLNTRYGYRIESTSANDKSVVFDPFGSLSQAAGKLLQPPGGAGSFTTSPIADTQYPVILSGPTVVTKTHDAAVIEWTTDEPADSQVRFGFETLDGTSTSADAEASHKIVLTNLTPGATYNYIIGATDPAGNGATESSQAVFTTNPEIDLTDPRITAGPEVVYKNNASATIRWTTDEDATGQVDFGPTQSLGFVRTLSSTDKVHEITLTNLTASTTYHYKASSSDLSNNGPTESEIFFFTTDATADLTPPVIRSVVATPADSSAIITWTTDEQANSFVDFGTDSLNLEFSVGAVENVKAHQITLTNLTPDIRYFFKVGSVDRANNPPAESAIGSFTTAAEADTTPPAVPFDLKATVGNKQVLLSWDAELEFDLNGFKVYRRTGEAAFAPIVSGLRQTSFADLNVANGTTYQYQVTAIDRQTPPNESGPSASIEATPMANAAPSAPTSLTRTGDDVLRPTFVFTNAAPFNEGATLTYTIQVSTQADFSNVTASISGLAEGAGNADPGQTAWAITRTLTQNQTYYWRVRAVEGSLIGPFSATQQFAAREAVALPGDFNNDEKVDFDDFFLFVDAFGQEAIGELAIFDLDAGGTIDFNDFFIFVDNFGKSAAGKRWSVTQTVDDRAIFSVEAIGGTRTDDQGRVTVRIRADQIEQLKGFGLVLRYDPQAVIWENATPGPGHLLTSQGGQAPLFQVLAQTPGQLVIGSGITQGEPVSGHGLLAELNFRVIGAATTTRFDLAEALVARSGSDVRRVAQLHSAALRPQTFYLGANFPNPFNPMTSIEYGLPAAGPAELSIYDVLGRKVRTLMQEETQPAGFYTAVWDGQDSAGRPVGSGIYFYRLQTPQFTRTAKMTLLK